MVNKVLPQNPVLNTKFSFLVYPHFRYNFVTPLFLTLCEMKNSGQLTICHKKTNKVDPKKIPSINYLYLMDFYTIIYTFFIKLGYIDYYR